MCTAVSAEVSAAPDSAQRTLLLVAGSGRSGTSLLAGMLQQLGFYVPEPEIKADPSNPKGFGEPQWVVEFHNRLLGAAAVHPSDARPSAWYEAGKAAMAAWVADELRGWLDDQLAGHADVVVKDPRLSWFFPAWRRAARETEASLLVLSMLRHPAEVVASKVNWYGGELGPPARLAGWLNMMLYTERATRGSARAFLRYDDLLEDWPHALGELAERYDLAPIRSASVPAMRRIYDFVDPDLRRTQATWDEVDVPDELRKLADRAWEGLNAMADETVPPADPTTQAELDDVRAAYVALYQESEAIAASTLAAVRRAVEAQPAPEQPPIAAAAEQKPALATRLAARIPERARRRVPEPLRKSAWRVVGAVTHRRGA